MAFIFISHSSKDEKFAFQLGEDLKEFGHSVWLDKWRIKVGQCIPTEIEKGLSRSDFVIVVLTPDAVMSGWVDKEWKNAYWEEIEKKKSFVLPILFRDCVIPKLLKTKKYADFRKNYSIGFAQLIQSITPANFEEDKSIKIDQAKEDKEISELITKVQGKQILLSQCIAEAIPIAHNYNDEKFVYFCKNELTGWEQEDIDIDSDKLNYRLAEVYISFSKLNPRCIGCKSASEIFSYIEENPNYFMAGKMIVPMSISKLERKELEDPNKFYIHFTKLATDFIPNHKDKEAKVYCYAKISSINGVLEAIRVELTTRLINLLPKIEKKS